MKTEQEDHQGRERRKKGPKRGQRSFVMSWVEICSAVRRYQRDLDRELFWSPRSINCKGRWWVDTRYLAGSLTGKRGRWWKASKYFNVVSWKVKVWLFSVEGVDWGDRKRKCLMEWFRGDAREVSLVDSPRFRGRGSEMT